MIEDLYKTQDNIKELRSLDETRYENIFRLAKDDKYFFYNISKKVNFPDELDSELFTEVRVTTKMPWTTFANQVYGDQNLWWLICSLNKVHNPIDNPKLGEIYKVIKPTYVSRVLIEINKQLT